MSNEDRQLLGPLSQEILGIQVCADEKVPLPPTLDEVVAKTAEIWDGVLLDYCHESCVAFRDRLPDPLTPEQIRFALGLSRPPRWRFIARRRWRKRYEEAMRQSNEETK